MTDAPVSVIIPVYNSSELLVQALGSVVGQTCRPKEIIVVDDGSTDEPARATKNYSGIVFLRLPRSGAAAARNEGARRASQTFLAFLDADDLWPKARTELLLAPFSQGRNIQISSGCIQQFRAAETGAVEILGPPVASRLPSASLIRTDDFHRVGGFSPEWQVGETIEWCARAMDAGLASAAIPEIVLQRRVHASNLGKTAQDPGKAYVRMLHAVIARRRNQNTPPKSGP